MLGQMIVGQKFFVENVLGIKKGFRKKIDLIVMLLSRILFRTWLCKTVPGDTFRQALEQSPV